VSEVDKSDRGMLMGTIPPERNPRGKKILLAVLGIFSRYIAPVDIFMSGLLALQSDDSGL
jgi:hypothetical protein